MVLGYDEARPEREDYGAFLSRFAGTIGELDESGISLMIYGSYVRGDYVAGRSDIDAVLVFPDDVVIEKERFGRVSSALDLAYAGIKVPFQVTVSDLTTMKDGRFNSFEPNFEKYFAEEGRVLVGPDYRNQFKYSVATLSDQTALRFNLRKVRQGLLFFDTDECRDYTKLLGKFGKTLDATSRASKQILTLIDGEVRKNRFSALEDLAEVFPGLDLGPLEEIRAIYTNLELLDELYNEPSEVRRVWNNSVSFFEKLVKCYIERQNPS